MFVEQIVQSLSYSSDHLEWRVADWGPCLPGDSELSKMGAGSMERNVTCVLTSHEGFQVSTLAFYFDYFNPMIAQTLVFTLTKANQLLVQLISNQRPSHLKTSTTTTTNTTDAIDIFQCFL